MQETFLSALLDCFHAGGKGPLRQMAWDLLVQRGLPHKKEEAFGHVPLLSLYEEGLSSICASAPMAKSEVLSHVAPECLHSHLTFVDGILRLDLSDVSALAQSLVILSLEQSFETFGHFLKTRVQRNLLGEKDPFALLNAALMQGAFVFVPPKTVCTAPLQCLYLFSGAQKSNACLSNRLHFFIGAHAQIELTTKTVNENSCSFYTSYCDVALEEGARCSYSALLEGAKQGWHFDYLRATLKRSSTFKGVSWTSGGKTMRQDMHLMLAGENAEVDLRGGWLLEEKHQAHTHVRIDHQFPHCRSLQRFKGVVKGNSRSSFAGKICVAKEAQKTEAYQVNHNLVLDKGAIAYSMPNLEIFADDVKASHGSTVSQIDPTQLFYMQTRGIDECTAKKWLTMGFCQEIINQISIEGVRCQAQQIVQGAGHGCL